jgi:DNA-binding transcriptional LysR family regulator
VSEVLVVNGPVGVGKTTIGWEMTEVLDERGLPFGFYDPDAIHFRPAEDGDPFNSRVWLAALAAAWPLMGVERLIVPVVVEDRAAAERLVPGADLTVARLTAPATTLDDRIRKRELGAGLDWHLARAHELEAHWRDHPVEDFVVETHGRGVREISVEVLTRSGWI